ncbi:MAG: DnaJ C-terminal domain-containing protein [Desulfovibrionales bacterium]
MSVKYKDYYKLLGVSKDASKEDLSRAFKKLARKYHPDLNPDDKEAETKFKEINEAYEVLKDPEKRKLYDSLGPNWQEGMNFQPPPGYENVRFDFGGGGGPQGFDMGGFSDFFETIFGGAGPRTGRRTSRGFPGGSPFGESAYRSKGQDVEAELSLTLEEAYRGGKKTITLQEPSRDFRGFASQSTKSLEVNIPPGIRDGAKIRLAGQGGAGSGGGPAGDLFLRVRLKEHPRFKLDGKNIIYDLQMAPWEAALGATLRVETLDGAVDMNIPAGISSGQKLRIKGKGLGRRTRGDQLVRIMIKTPKPLSDRQKELWESLARESKFDPRG